jgi:hypothetical protein
LFFQVHTMRTYDKLIATIPARQGAEHLRACLGGATPFPTAQTSGWA